MGARTEQIAISEEETQDVQVDETTILWEIITNGTKGKYPNGIWFGGNKYTLVRGQAGQSLFLLPGESRSVHCMLRSECCGWLQRGREGPEGRQRSEGSAEHGEVFVRDRGKLNE